MQTLGLESFTLTFDPETRSIELKTPWNHTIRLDDTNRSITLKTERNQSVVLDDASGSITLTTSCFQRVALDATTQSVKIEDGRGNEWSMGESGISVSSAKDLVLKASGAIRMETSGGAISLASGSSLDLKGLEVNVDALATASIKGGASATVTGGSTAELSAGVEVVVKSAMVMIN